MPKKKRAGNGLDISPWLSPDHDKAARERAINYLQHLPITGHKNQRCWSLLRRKRAFFLKLGRTAVIVFVDSGGWAHFPSTPSKAVHAVKLINAAPASPRRR